MRHFLDTNASEHCGIVRVIINGRQYQPYPTISNVTHFRNVRSNPARSKLNPSYESLAILTGHWGHYFQHFFDNIGPQISLIYDALGHDLSDIPVLVDESPLFPNVPKLWARLGFKTIIPSISNQYYEARNLVLVESAPRIHPVYFQHLRTLLKLKISQNPKKIIWINRKTANSYFNQRMIQNQESVIRKLKEMYDVSFVVYDHSKYSLDETIALFGNARAIIGSHGGGMYNQFFAPTSAVIVEIMPVKPNGLYPEQLQASDIPTFSHMAVWSNSLLIGQQFWRYYEITNDSNFFLDVSKFADFLEHIPDLNPKHVHSKSFIKSDGL